MSQKIIYGSRRKNYSHIENICKVAVILGVAMEKELMKLINSGNSIEEILEALKKLRTNKTLRCNECNHKLGDVEDGILIIKCRCGEYVNYII